MLIFEKSQLPSLRKVNAKELKETVELVNSVIHNVITDSITELNNLLYAGAYVIIIQSEFPVSDLDVTGPNFGH